MRPRPQILLVLAASLTAGAETVDRIAASVAGRVVTVGEVRRQLRLAAFAGNSTPDYSPENLRKTAAMLVDQALVRREAELSRYTPPARADVEVALDRFAESRRVDRQRLVEQLSAYGFSEDDLRAAVEWQIMLARFIDFRFRPGVQVAEEEIAAYYRDRLLPQWKPSGGETQAPTLEEVRSRIAGILTVEKATAASLSWLEQLRQQLPVRYYEEAFR